MTSNDKWQGNSNAGRDGKNEKRDVKSILKGTRGTGRFNNAAQSEGNSYGKPEFKKRDDSRPNTFERKPYGNRDVSNNSDRPSYGNRSDGDRPSYGNRSDGDRPSYGNRPSFNNDRSSTGNRSGGYNNDRPSYGNRPSYNNDRPSFNNDRSASGSRPSFNRGEGGSYGNSDNQNSYGNRPAYGSKSAEDGSGKRVRFTTRRDVASRTEGASGEKLTFRKPSEVPASGGNFVETRFDNDRNDSRFRKPRAKQQSQGGKGAYSPNNKYSKKKQLEYRNAYVDLSKPVRLNKFLANAGICSRREADEFIAAGVISVNDVIVTELGKRVMHTDKVMFHNQQVRVEKKVYILLNKPKDVVTTVEDTHARKTVLDIVKNACSERIYPVGRLDRNTTGVILLTNDGDLASRLTHPGHEKKKIYHVALDNDLTEEAFKQILEGVQLDNELVKADNLSFVKEGDLKQVGIEIHSGQNRVVRRIFDSLGYKVLRLDRVFFAGLTKKNLPRGKYRFLNEREVNMLMMGAYE
jgi:23S rRNA pseudouridine2605 synthase